MQSDLPDLGPYRAEASLGIGGVGEVFQATAASGPVAIKVLHREVTDTEPFLSAARRLQGIEHPNLVRVLDVGDLPSGRSFVAMELLGGRDLGDVLAERGSIPFLEAVDLGRQSCRGLRAAHAVGVVHSDLKPNNVRLIDEAGFTRVKLLDFGAVPRRTEGAHVLDGTPEYWSPEQATGDALTPRSDIYSLGVVLYEILTGETPFSSHSVSDVVAQHLRKVPARMDAPPGEPMIPARLETLVLRCLAKEPAARFQSAEELEAALSQIGDETAAMEASLERLRTTSEVAGAVAVQPPPRLRMGLVGALVVGGLVVLAAALALPDVLRRSAPTPTPVARITVTLSSDPSGAVVLPADGGAALGVTPATIEIPAGDEPVALLFHFPDGARRILEVVPDQPSRIHATAPSPRGGARP